MIVMVESGRLGNQLFQYLALTSVARADERIVLIGFDQLQATFTGIDAEFKPVNSRFLTQFLALATGKYASLTRVIPGLGLIQENEKALPIRDPRSPLALALPAWFQTPAMCSVPAAQNIGITESALTAALEFLLESNFDAHHTYFVHVRAGDYRIWPTPENPAILGVDWYRQRIREICADDAAAQFVIIGDDLNYAHEVAEGIGNARIFHQSETAEFALMTLCAGGILSASSFAFWGAFFAKRNSPGARFIAPRYWAGHQIQTWYPENIEADFITYV